jgi:hypothetical protein
MYVPVNNFLIPNYMSTKMGRPKLPQGESKHVQIGVRFKPREDAQLEKSADQEKLDKVAWLRQAAIEATKEWIKCEEWTMEDLHDKTVEFEVVLILEGPVKGTGTFDMWQRGDGLFKIRIISYDRKSTAYEKHELCIYVPQRGVKWIKRLPPGSRCDFSVIDPAFQRCVRGAA